MEIIRTHFPDIFNEVITLMPSHHAWRDFVYCHTVIGKHLARVDHFDDNTTPTAFWEQTPTAVVHLPQNKFEDILRKNIVIQDDDINNINTILYGAEVFNINYKNKSNKTEVFYTKTHSNHKITCDYLIAADGSNSYIRRKLGIPMIGNDSLQTLVNVHFKCKGLDRFLKPRPAMLYFSFNEHMVSVFVAHDPKNDEWVCQIPIFPPFQALKDYTKEKMHNLLSLSLGLQSLATTDVPTIEIMNINHWTMHSQVAESFQGNIDATRNIFLVGDCAHRFPPSGGFGMNTGIQDVHNISWKLALVTKGLAKEELLATYDEERKPIANANASLSMRNYDKSALAARLLGVDPSVAKTAINTFNTSIASSLLPLTIRSMAVNAMVSTGLSTLKYLKNDYDIRTVLLKNMINSGKSLPLIFPEEDIGFQYQQGCVIYTTNNANKNVEFETISDLRIGGRVPHCWLGISNHKDNNELYVVSTLDLPCYINKKEQVPKLLLMINNDYTLWKEAIEKYDVSDSITIIRITNNNMKYMNHQNLQRMKQKPGYMHTISSNYNNEKVIINDYIHDNNCIVFDDICCRWTEICRKYNTNNVGVIIRPDGHILGIHSNENNNIKTFSKFIKNVMTKFVCN